MGRSLFKTVITSLLFGAVLFGGYSCSDDDYLTEEEVNRLIEEALRKNNQKYLDELQIKALIEEALRENGNYLTEEQLSELIKKILKENSQDFEFTQWEIVPFTVQESHWGWNEDAGRYEAVYDLPELTEHIYENGAVLGYVFIGQQGVNEVQKLLPYVHTYGIYDDAGNIVNTYTETISFDVQYAPNGGSTIAFFIQASDLVQADEYLVDYNFRIVLIWK